MEFLGTKMHSQKYKWQQFYDSPIELTQLPRTNVRGSIFWRIWNLTSNCGALLRCA